MNRINRNFRTGKIKLVKDFLKIPEFVQICREIGIEWKKIVEICWRCGGTYIYIPKFPERIEKKKNIILDYEREKQKVGEEKAFNYIVNRKGISKKTLKRILNNKNKILRGC